MYTEDLISRQAAIDALNQKKIYRPLDSDRYVISDCLNTIVNLPSVQLEDWMEQNKDRILKAGMEGREVEFMIGGRLFAIREKAQ